LSKGHPPPLQLPACCCCCCCCEKAVASAGAPFPHPPPPHAHTATLVYALGLADNLPLQLGCAAPPSCLILGPWPTRPVAMQHHVIPSRVITQQRPCPDTLKPRCLSWLQPTAYPAPSLMVTSCCSCLAPAAHPNWLPNSRSAAWHPRLLRPRLRITQQRHCPHNLKLD
jgi:hypothetical protein